MQTKHTLVLILLWPLTAFGLDTKDVSLYGRIALVSTMNFENGAQGLGDNSSRLGVQYDRDDIFDDWKVGLRAEWSISTNRNNSGFGSSSFDGKKYDVTSNDGPFGNRLGYLWIAKGNFSFAAGKMWSAFYDVPAFTDLFQTDGARASSVYTRTGEVDGTYRASEIIQARYETGRFQFALQTKLTSKETVEYDFDDDATPESTLVYKQVQAASIRYVTESITLGISSINMMFDNNGKGESQLSLSYGAKLNYKDFFLNTVYTRAKDLELNEVNNTFVHSDGTEAILGYRLNPTSTFMLGLNHQTRTESGDFQLLYYYASFTKRINDFTLSAESIYGDSTRFDGSEEKEKLLKLAAILYF